jgi:adenylate cyclase
MQGRNVEAKASMLRALELNPQSHNFLADLGQIYYFNREYGEAEEYCLRALKIYPDFAFAHEYLADIYFQTGEYERAVEEEIRAQATYSMFKNEPARWREEFQTRIEEQRALYREGGHRKFVKNLIAIPHQSEAHFLNSKRYALLGDKENALNLLEKAIDTRAFHSPFIKVDPVFDSVRDDPQYKRILLKINLTD